MANSPLNSSLRRGGVPWWALSPAALIVVLVVVIGIAMMGAVTPATSNAAAAAANAGNGACTITPTTTTGGISPTATSGADPLTADPTNIGGVRLDATQLLNAQTIVGVGKGLVVPASVGALAIALAVSFQDTHLSTTAASANGVGVGLFLQMATDYPGVNRTDPAAAAAAFLTQLLAWPPYTGGQSLGQVAFTMQGPTVSTAADYQAQEGWASALATVLNDGTPAAATRSGLACVGGGTDNTTFAAGNIISDAVFYNAAAMTVEQIRAFTAQQGWRCAAANPWCLKNLTLTTPAKPADKYCAGYPGGTDQDAAAILAAFSLACGINPQVMLTTLQKESQGLTRADPGASSWDSAWGWGCPDTGPGGTANCSADDRGFFAQGYQMAHQWAKYRSEIPRRQYNYAVGTYHILWNVAESGCGGADVTIQNVATASLYVYTPYQPNVASIAGYPGTGNACSSYGNRNFFYLFRSYFGSTGGGAPVTTPAGATVGGPITVNGTTITLPTATGLMGTITAPTPTVAHVITAGLNWLGQPYSWGGGSPAGPTRGQCPGSGCGVTGFDCSGLMLYVWAQVGISIARYSQTQWASGTQIPYSQALPGDMLGYPGHIAMYLGRISAATDTGEYMLEAPDTGSFVRITKVRNGHYATVSRVWTGR